MKKPKLSDYGLDEKAIVLYETQSEKYSQLKKKIEEENNAYNKKLVFIAIVLVIVAIAIFVGVLKKSENPIGVLFPAWILHTLVLVVLSCVDNKEDTPIGSVLLQSIFGSAVFPFISIGVCIYVSFVRNDEYISKECPKERYVNVSVENRINAYTEAVREYKNWKEKCAKDYWVNMSGYQFEDAITKLYETQGYSAEQTSYSGDGGVDIVLFKEGRKIAVQCKHHSKPVGPNDVRALMGVVASQGFDEGIFVSLNGFTTTVYDEVRRSSIVVKLVALPTILSMVEAEDAEIDKSEKKSIPLKKENKIVQTGKDTTHYKPSTNTPENLKVVLGQSVYHKILGAGSIIQFYDGGIIIRFGDEEKKFKFPDAFQQGFLSLYPIKTTAKPKYIEAAVIDKEENAQVFKKCTGNCSTCKREVCIEDN